MRRYVNKSLHVRYDTFGLSTIAREILGVWGRLAVCGKNGDGDCERAKALIMDVLDPSEYSLCLHFTTFIHTHIHRRSYAICMLFAVTALVYNTKGTYYALESPVLRSKYHRVTRCIDKLN